MAFFINEPNDLVQMVGHTKTKIKVVIHSHHSTTSGNVYEFTNDVTSFSSSKTTAGAGTATITFIPRMNLLNAIFPNDYVNVYINRGDGEGYTRTFFGLIDRISEESTMQSDGKPSTTMRLACSDFSKVVEKTHVYNNVHLKDRPELSTTYLGEGNIGGLAMKSTGVLITGSPPDCVINNLIVMLGGAGQFVLPEGYTSRLRGKLRKQRAEFAIGRLERDFARSLPAGDVEQLARTLKREFVDQITSPGTQLSKDAIDTVGYGSSQLAAQQGGTTVAEVLQSIPAANEIYTKIANTAGDKAQQLSAVLNTTSTLPSSILDIIDLFTYVERGAIDGYLDSAVIWQQQGALGNIIRGMTNDIVNEMFFDLRASSKEINFGLVNTETGGFSREPDEIGGNIDTKGGVAGVQLLPCLVMREYPFSVVEGFDASNIKLKFTDAGGSTTLGFINFGRIFSLAPNRPGRHVVSVPNINVEDKEFGVANDIPANKHIDVAVIRNQDIISSSFGRSDNEHFNLLEVISDAVMGSEVRYFMQDVTPILSPIQILRNGLRVRSVNTRFAHFPEMLSNKINPPPKDVESLSDEGTPESAEVLTGTFVLPFDASVTPTRKSVFGYRIRDSEDENWTFHYGTDFYVPRGTPVRAMADGYIVAVAPTGVCSSYGNTVIIKHSEQYQGKRLFTQYSHFDSFEPSIVAKTNPTLHGRPDNRQRCFSKELAAGTKMPSLFVQAGTIIGYVGDTAGTAKNINARFKNSSTHLHIETWVKSYPASSALIAPVDTPTDQPKPATPASSLVYDPESWMNAVGLTAYNTVPTKAEADHASDEPETPGLNDDATQLPDERTESKPSRKRSSSIDNTTTRLQLMRWTFLMDHWFQHNNEYLSGQIKMVGAPDIRVGYRLDLIDRAMSFYIEGVSHEWTYPGAMTTTLAVTRGQPQNPYPGYVLPNVGKGSVKALSPKTEVKVQRGVGSRLDEHFIYPDSSNTRRGKSINIHSKGLTKNVDSSENFTDKREYNELINPALPFEATVDPDTMTKEELQSLDNLIEAVKELKPNVGTATGIVGKKGE